MELTGAMPMFPKCLKMWPKVSGAGRGSTDTTLQQFFLGYRWAVEVEKHGKTLENLLLSARSQVPCTEIVYIQSTQFRLMFL